MSTGTSTLTVSTFTDKKINIKVNFNYTTVKDIIEILRIHYQYKCDIELYKINFIHNQNKIKCRNSTLYELGLRGNHEEVKMYYNNMSYDNDCYPSKELQDESMDSYHQIFVRDLKRKLITIGLTNDMTIEDVKKLVFVKTGFPHHSFHLLRNFVRLDSSRTILDYAIEKEETLNMALKLRGGPINESIKMLDNPINF